VSGVWPALLLTLFGGAVVWTVNRDERRPPVSRAAWAVALAAPCGFGLASLLSVGWRAAAGRPASEGLAVFLLALPFAILAIIRRLGHPASAAVEDHAEAAPARAPILLAGGALLVAAGFAARAVAAYWVEIPLGAFDAVATWNLRARLLHLASGDLSNALDATNYPLLLPGAISFQWSLAGAVSTVAARATGAGFLAATALLLAACPRRGGRALGYAAAALFLATPFAVGQGSSQEADVPTACYLLASAALLASRLRATPGPPAELAGLALGLLVWTKNEGLLWAGFALALFALTDRRAARRDAPRLALGLAPGLVALALFKLVWAPDRGLSASGFLEGEALGRLADGARWREIGGALVERLDPTAGPFPWGFAWLFLAVAAVGLRILRAELASSESRFLSRLALATVGCVPIVYALTPLPLAWHLGTSLDRLLLQLYPLALAAVAAAAIDLTAPAGGGGPTGPERAG